MNFLLTEYGTSWFDANPGALPEFTEFRVGDGVNYIPNPSTDTDLRGNLLFSGSPGKPELTPTGEIKYLVFMDTSVGDFNWGEIGLFHNGSLFALGTTSAPVPKRKLTGSQEGNKTTIEAYLFPGSNYVVAELANSSNAMNVQIFNSLDRLPPAHQAQPNIYIIPNPTAPAKASLAFAAGGVWNVSGYEMAVYTSSIVSASASNIRLASDIDMPTEQGALLVGIISGPAAGLIRTATAWDPATRVLTLSSPLQWNPEPGDLVHLARYTAVGSLSVYQMLEELDPNLKASDLNQLIDLDSFFDPVLKRDGSNQMLANLNAGGNRIVNLGAPALSSDAATKGYVDHAIANGGADLTVFLRKDGSVAMEGLLNMASNRVINLSDGVAPSDATTLSQVGGLISTALGLYVRTDGSKAMTGPLSMANHRIMLVGNPVAGTDAVNFNTLTNHLTNLQSQALLRDGSQPMQASLNAGGYRLRNVGSATQPTDATTLQDVNTLLGGYLRRDGSVPMSGTLNMGNLRIAQLGAPTQPTDAVNSAHLESRLSDTTADLLKQDGSLPLTGDLDADNHKILSVGDPTLASDAANKGYVDSTIADSVSALSAEILHLDGSLPMGGDLVMGGHFIHGIADPVLADDASSKSYVDSSIAAGLSSVLHLDGTLAMTGVLNMGGNSVQNVAAPTNPTDAATKKYVDDELAVVLLADGSRPLSGTLDADGNRITGVADPTGPTDAVNLAYLADSIEAAGVDYLQKDGSIALEGNLNLGLNRATNAGAPVDPNDLATKAYVDSAVATDLTVFVLRDGTRPLTGDLSTDGNRITGLPDEPTDDSDAVSYAGLSQVLANQALLRDGSSPMAGNLSMGTFRVTNLGEPADASDATSKQYVDGLDSLNLRRDGSRAMQGALDMNTHRVVNAGMPTDANDLATKQYVDSAIPSALTGMLRADGSVPMTGNLNLGTINRVVNLAPPQANTDAATKKYVDDILPLVVLRSGSQSVTGDLNLGGNLIKNLADPESEQDAATKAYVDSAVASVDTSVFLPRDGSQFMLGHLNMGLRRIINLTDPEDPEDAATKAYVDGLFSDFLPRDGSQAMSGSFNFGGFPGVGLANPSANTDAANKQYVDNAILSSRASLVTRDGTQGMTGPLFMGNNPITDLADPVSDQDAATKAYVDDSLNSVTADFVKVDGTVQMEANLNAGGFSVVNLMDPSTPQSAATKSYVDNAVGGPIGLRTVDDEVYTLQPIDAGLHRMTRLDGVNEVMILASDSWPAGTVFNLRAVSAPCMISTDTYTFSLPDGFEPTIESGGMVTLIVVDSSTVDVFGSLSRT